MSQEVVDFKTLLNLFIYIQGHCLSENFWYSAANIARLNSI